MWMSGLSAQFMDLYTEACTLNKTDTGPGMINFQIIPNFWNVDLERGYSCESSRSGLIFWGGDRMSNLIN